MSFPILSSLILLPTIGALFLFFTKDKDPWLKLSDDVICFEKMYDPKKTWPEESLKRYGEYLKVINK